MERAKKSIILIVVMYCLAFVHSANGKSEAKEVKAEAELRQVALFKNGLGFFVYEVTCPKKNDSFSFVPCAAASHGSFWVSYPPKVELEGLTAMEVDTEEMVEAVTVGELLRANVGRKVSVVFDDEQIIGVIKHFADDRKGPEPKPYGPGGAEVARVNYRGASLAQSRLVIIGTDKGEVCIDPYSVKKVEFPGGKAEKRFARKKKSMEVGVKLGAAAAGKKLTVSYLAKGITWAPSYIVDITEGDEARISAKAAVINEVCELDDVTVQLITGFPNLQFADVVSPLAKKENLGQFLAALAKGQSEIERRGVMYNVAMQRAGAFEDMGAPVSMPAYGAAEAGKVAEDLFLYPVEDVRLGKGEVGYLPLFTESVPYKHIYKWEIPDYVNEEDRYFYGRRGQEREAVEEVWHCLRMENKTKVPWTTAPAEIVKEGLILGQDTLDYTPAEGETTVKITQAVGVKAEQVELEIERKRDAARLYGNHYDLVTVEGKLSVRNFQAKAITLEITKTLSGEVKSSEPEAKIESLARGLRRMNAVRELTWKVELGAGERKELNYLYEVYVRR